MEPIHVLVLDTVMDRGGAEAMIMNYMRNIDRDIIKFDFLTNRDYRAAYEDEIICALCIRNILGNIKRKFITF